MIILKLLTCNKKSLKDTYKINQTFGTASKALSGKNLQI